MAGNNNFLLSAFFPNKRKIFLSHLNFLILNSIASFERKVFWSNIFLNEKKLARFLELGNFKSG